MGKAPNGSEKQEKAKMLFSSSDDEADEVSLPADALSSKKSAQGTLKINEAYASKYDEVKRKKELHSLISKYGNANVSLSGDGDDGDEDDEETDEEDDDAVLLTEDKELAFAKAFLELKRRGPSKREDSAPFFPSADEQLKENTEVFQEALKRKQKDRKKKHTLADEYHRAIDASKTGALPDDNEVDNESGAKRLVPRSEKERSLRDAFLQSAEEVGDFAAVRKEGAAQSRSDPGEEAKTSESHRLLKDAFGDDDGDGDETFIKQFFLNELWRQGDEEKEDGVDYAAMAEADRDDMFYDDADVWEQKFQEKKYRHEEETDTHIQTFPRPIGEAGEGLLRKQDGSRKDARERRKDRQMEARQKQVEELKRLKHLKRQEIDDQRALIASVSGLSKSGDIDDEDEDAMVARLKSVWSEKDFDAPFDPVEFDKKMAAIFNDEYYQEDNVDEDEIQFMENELDEEEEEQEEEDDRGSRSTAAATKGKADHSKSSNELYGASDSLDYLLYPSKGMQELDLLERGEGNEEEDREVMLAKLKDSLREKEHAYDRLHHDAAAPFKYREVPVEDFTLSIEDILTQDDRQLNVIAPMNCYAAYLDKFSNDRDRRRIENRRSRGFREVGSDRTSRRYRNVKNTTVIDDSVSEQEGIAISKRLEAAMDNAKSDGSGQRRHTGGLKRQHGKTKEEPRTKKFKH